MSVHIEISIIGPCIIRMVGDVHCEIRSPKHRALIAILALSPLGRASRQQVQNLLWGAADYDSGNQNLRRALSDLRKHIGPQFQNLFHTTKSDIELDLSKVRFIRPIGPGPILADLNIATPAYAAWIDSQRRAPQAINALLNRPNAVSAHRAKPQITVFPLLVIDPDPNLHIFSDWVAQELCRSLSRSNLISVISHLSARSVLTNILDIPKIRETLDVDYILTGSLRPSGDYLVIDFDFIDTQSGHILWNRNIETTRIHATQAIVEPLYHVVEQIGHTISDHTVRYVRTKSADAVDTHQLLLAGVTMMHRPAMRDFLAARDFLQEACERQPHFSENHAWLAKWHILNVFKGLTTDREGDTTKALDGTARALDLDPNNSFSLTINGFAHSNLCKELDIAAQRYEMAQLANPNESLSWLLRGSLMAFQDDGAAAIRSAQTAQRLSPIDPFRYYYDSLTSSAYLAGENYEMALDYANRSLAKNDRHISTLRAKITALFFLDRLPDAQATATELMRRFPEFSIRNYQQQHPSAQGAVGKRVIEALKKSGIQ